MRYHSLFILKGFFMASLLFLLFPLISARVEERSGGPGSQTERPNILFLLIDDMAWNGLSCYGDPYIYTPNIDRLAETGMKFTRAYVAPECTPTRAAVLSGQYGARTHMTQVHTTRSYPYAPLITPRVRSKLPEDNYTVANMLRDAGYITAISGKWHVGDADAQEKQEYYGFDFVGTAHEKPWDEVDKDKATPAQTDEVLRFIEENREHPFFVYLSYFNIHTPLQAPDSLVEKYLKRGFPESTQRFGDATERPTAQYLAMTNLLDNEIGRLMEGLERMGLKDRTMVVFISDNGGLNRAWNNCPLRGAKGLLYEGGIRVPLIVTWPGVIRPKTISDIPVHIIDFYATFLELSGGSVPGSKILDGESLLPLLIQTGSLNRDALLWHHPHYIHDYGKTPSSAIMKGDWKLIHYYGDYLDTRGYMPVQDEPFGDLVVGERVELFNLNEDPGENRDLSETKPMLTSVLLSELNARLDSMDAPMPRPNPDSDVRRWYIKAHW